MTILLGHNLRLLAKFTGFLRTTTTMSSGLKGLPLNEVIKKLNDFAPLSLAEKWDNVGLLIEPHTQRQIKTILLTNDLTEVVMKEAISIDAQLIVSYHPPVFAPLKRITQATWKERIVSQCLENRIALYSPHTAWDAVEGGVNDWLIDVFGVGRPISPNVENPQTGAGRICTTKLSDLDIETAIHHLKLVTDLNHLNVALGCDSTLTSKINTIAVCGGSGASVLKSAEANLFITGEMSHHDVLDATQRNITVILTNHSNSERGFLRIAQKKLLEALGPQICEIVLSKVDVDPLLVH